MTTTTTRADLDGRLTRIRDRIRGRATDLADIGHRQLLAATAGDEPDPALGEARRVLLDAQAVDEQAVTVLTAELDQIDAADVRLRDLTELATLRRRSAEKVREAQEAANAYPAAQQAAIDALRAAGVDLHRRLSTIRQLTQESAALTDGTRAMAERLGEPVGAIGVVDHVERLAQLYPAGSNPRVAAIFGAALRNPVDTVASIGTAVGEQMAAEAISGSPTSFVVR